MYNITLEIRQKQYFNSRFQKGLKIENFETYNDRIFKAKMFNVKNCDILKLIVREKIT